MRPPRAGKPRPEYRLDREALATLTKTYWGAGGWKPPLAIQPAEAVAHAVACGVMFEPGSATLTHDAVVTDVCAQRDAVIRAEVTEAFLASLTSRRLDLRSALGSWAVAQRVVPHRMTGRSVGSAGRLPAASGT